MNIAISLLLLTASLLGFYLLETQKAILWLVFLIVAYPPALAFMRAGPLPATDLITLYRIGVSQIPFIGKIIQGLLSPKEVKDRD